MNETLNEQLDELERLIGSGSLSRKEIAAKYDDIRSQAFASEHGSDEDHEPFYERIDLSEAEWRDSTPFGTSVGASVGVEFSDGKVVLVVDLGTVVEALEDRVADGEISEGDAEFLSRLIRHGVELVS